MDSLKRTPRIPTITVALDYARLSRDRKKLSENVGIQHRENRYFIEDQGWEYGSRPYDDNDISASKFGKKTRDDYLAMVEAIKNWPDREDTLVKLVIVVTEMPRLYRQVEELLPLIKMAESTKLSGIWTTDGEGYDLSTPEGIHRAIGAVNNAMLESNRASKRQLRKKKAQVKQGKYIGGQRRYGFEGPIKDEHGNILNHERINVAEIPDEIKHWQDWFDRLLAGESQMSVVRDNNKRGIPSPKGGKWTVGNFKRLMCNEAYVIFDAEGHDEDCPCLLNDEGNGTLFHKTSGERHRGLWHGLITKQQHELLLSSFDTHGQHWDHGLVRGRQYLLSGLIFCGGTYHDKPCLAPMYGNGRKLENGTYQRRYKCKSTNNHAEIVACGKVFRGSEPLDLLVTEAVLYRLDTPEVARLLAPQEDTERAEEIARKIIAQRKRRDLIKKQYARGEIESLDEYKFMRSEADTAIEELQIELSKLKSVRAVKLLPGDGKIREAWDNASIEWRRSVIQLVVEKIIVHPSTPGSKLWNGYRFKPEDIEIIWRC